MPSRRGEPTPPTSRRCNATFAPAASRWRCRSRHRMSRRSSPMRRSAILLPASRRERSRRSSVACAGSARCTATTATTTRRTKHPSVRNALRGARKRLRDQPVGRKSALKLEDLEQMLKRIPNTNAGRRDRALLLLGLAGALRRSELVALQGEDITHTGEGILVRIRTSKTDQTGKGFTIPIARGDRDSLCAVRALENWQAASGIHNGALFVQVRKGDHITERQLSDKAVALIIKARAQAVGLDPELLAGHSLRAGGITQARRNGHDEGEIAKLSGHKNIAILRTYLRPDDDFEGTAQVLRSDRGPR